MIMRYNTKILANYLNEDKKKKTNKVSPENIIKNFKKVGNNIKKVSDNVENFNKNFHNNLKKNINKLKN